MASGFGAGAGADMLQHILAQKFLEQQEANRQYAAEQQRKIQSRGQDIQVQGMTQAQGRFDTSRADAQAKDAQERADALAAAKGSEDFEQTLPAHLRASFHAAGHKQNFKPDEFVNAPETYEQADTRKLATFKTQEKFRTDENIRQTNATAKPDKPAVPQVFYDAEGKARSMQWNGTGWVEVPMPAGIVGRTPPKPAAKTPEQIKAESAARAAGTAEGKASTAGGGNLAKLASVFGFGGDAKPAAKVKMIAPDGTVSEVDASQVDHYKALGAKVQ
jgi:hypothetical protein